MADSATRVWVLYRANERTAQGCDDPGLDLEGFSTVREATQALGHRFALGTGVARFVHPDRAHQRCWTDWPDTDKSTAYAEVWLGPERVGQQPDATSAPDERWTHTGLLGVNRNR